MLTLLTVFNWVNPFLCQTMQAQSTTLTMETIVSELDEGVYHVRFNPDGGDLGNHIETYVVNVFMQFEYYQSGSNTPVYTQSINDSGGNGLRFYAHRTNANGRNFFLPMNFIYDYVIYVPSDLICTGGLDVSSINSIKIKYAIDNIGSPDLQVIESTLSFPASFGLPNYVCTTAFGTGIPNCEVVFEAAITGITVADNVPLQLLPATNTYQMQYCNMQTNLQALGYVVPYGGCPPYTHNWNVGFFQMYASYLANSPYEWGWDFDAQLGVCPSYPCTMVFENVVQSFSLPDSYNVTVTDANSATTQTTYNFTPAAPSINTATIMNNLIRFNDCSLAISVDNFNSAFSNYISAGVTPKVFRLVGGPNVSIAAGPGGTPHYLLNKPGQYLVSIENRIMECRDEFIFNLTIPDIFNSDFPTGYTPVNGQSWNSNQRIFGNLVINPGVTFTINNATIYFMDENSGIVIHPGGKLIVENSTLRNRIWCNNPDIDAIKHWQGIQVRGNENQPHPSLPFDPLTDAEPNHGILVIRNSTIQNAKVGAANTEFSINNNNPQPVSPHNGGIIAATNTTFLNNEIGLYFLPFRFANISTVQQCAFTTNANFISQHSTLNQYIGILMSSNSFATPMISNTFNNTLATDKQGIAVFNVSTQVQLGNAGTGNNFSGWYKSIDYYGFPSILRPITIAHNTFTNSPKAVTLNGGLLATINNNHFTVPQPATGTAYGILTDRATGFTIQNNYFTSPLTTLTNKVGIAVRFGGANQNAITNNVFEGRLAIANLYEGNNPFITIDCNQYHHPVLIDWFINPWFANDFLQNQGECDVFEPEKARRNSFKPAASGFYNHIANYSNTPFEYRAQSAQFLPTVNDETGAAVNETYCFDLQQPDHCTVIDDCNPNCLRQRLAAETDENARVALYTQLIKQLTDAGLFEQAKTALEEENREQSEKILIATYTDEQKPDSAMLKLLQLPLNSQDNIDFFALYTELLAGIHPPAGSGKAMGIQEQMVRSIAQREQ
ncbi:MAG TPA: hypothetical protein PK239_18480, partial [Chitinophagales bacterium]|nr:hypothetical protein [Chitinophagales bacterium]